MPGPGANGALPSRCSLGSPFARRAPETTSDKNATWEADHRAQSPLLLGRRTIPLGDHAPDDGQIPPGIFVVGLNLEGILKISNCASELALLGKRHSEEGMIIG